MSASVNDQNGSVLGGALPKGAPWRANPKGDLRYKDASGAALGARKLEIEFSRPAIAVKAKGSALGLPALPLSATVTAQLVNLDDGMCWESSFTTFRISNDRKFEARLP